MARISHMVLPVADLQQSRAWYVDKLGFSVDREQENVIGVKDQSGLVLFLMRQGASVPPARTLTFTIEIDHVDRTYAALSGEGVKFESPPKMHFWGYGAEVLDPNGYVNHLWDRESMARATQGRE